MLVSKMAFKACVLISVFHIHLVSLAYFRIDCASRESGHEVSLKPAALALQLKFM